MPPVKSLKKAKADQLGHPFHNPYTFISFTKGVLRATPTPLTADEPANEVALTRYTGVIRLRVTTQRPLLTSAPTPQVDGNGHKTFNALCIGEDVIVPSTGVRGALRSMMTVLTGGTLGYLNNDLFLCQGRDLNLGPAGKKSPPGTPQRCFLARVVQPGSPLKSGKIEVGRTELVEVVDLEKVDSIDEYRPKPGTPQPRIWVEMQHGKPKKFHFRNPPPNAWELKLSGRPVKSEGKREALFQSVGSNPIDIPAQLWLDYIERNKHSAHPELRKDDLIWLELHDKDASSVEKSDDIKSLQWARWGRRGTRLRDLIESKHQHVLPDSLRNDGLVDEVTDLFGQVPVELLTSQAQANDSGPGPISFAARIRPENLVFPAAKSKLKVETLAPLSSPHPGCIAFYRDNTNPDQISCDDPLKGYKVYRIAEIKPGQEPWKYQTQPVIDRGQAKGPRQKVNSTCELLPAGITGVLSIAFRALTKRELGLLLHACELPWRLGGGKPFSLGLCRLELIDVRDELGEPLQLEFTNAERLPADRVKVWCASQAPVNLLAYPRAAEGNQAGGHVWFVRHAKCRATAKDGNPEPGLEPIYISDELLNLLTLQAGDELDPIYPMVAGQVLQAIDPDNRTTDQLYGYDLDGQTMTTAGKKMVRKLTPFRLSRSNESRGGNSGGSRQR